MRKLTMNLMATALMLGAMVMAADAQTQASGAASLRAQIQNATPLIQQAACWGYDRFCPLGTTRVCGLFRCRCRVCH